MWPFSDIVTHFSLALFSRLLLSYENNIRVYMWLLTVQKRKFAANAVMSVSDATNDKLFICSSFETYSERRKAEEKPICLHECRQVATELFYFNFSPILYTICV